MIFGAHVSTAKPFSESINRATEIGCECMQIFVNPPQRWNPIPIAEGEAARFMALNASAKLKTIIHSIYLVNFASDNSFYYAQSIKSLTDDMQKAKQLGALGANTHLGSTKGKPFDESLAKVADGIKQVLAATAGDETYFIIENAAGAGDIIGDTLHEIGQIIRAVGSKRVKVLIDTAHAFESGYDLRAETGIAKFIAEFDREIGLPRLVGFHLNDSKTALSSKRDRHADLGTGEIGLECFKILAGRPEFNKLLGILETPQDQIPWREQLKKLKSFRNNQASTDQ